MDLLVRRLFDSAGPIGAALLLVAENGVILALALAGGRWLVRRFADRRVTPPPGPLSRREVAVAAATVLLNSLVTWVGLLLWRAELVRFRPDVGLRAWLDVPLLVLVMDAAMYGLHRLVHAPALYPWVHGLHHRYERSRPLTLFVLSPLEALGFGALWLAVIALYDASWLGMSIYLALNVASGVVGHLGVEPLPDGWVRAPLVRWLATSTFHGQHHTDRDHNFGFYTLLWDRLFGTLAPGYVEGFGRPLGSGAGQGGRDVGGQVGVERGP